VSWYIYVFAVLIVALLIGLIIPVDLTPYSPDTFPDEKFTKTFKKYSTKEIADALDEIADGI
jgi:hypothetical protein